MSALLLPLPQSPEYAKTLRLLNLPVQVRSADCRGQEVLRWQVQSRKLGPLGRVDLISRGPVGRDPDCLSDWLLRFNGPRDGRPLLINAEGLSGEQLRAVGFWPMMTPGTLGQLSLGPAQGMRAALKQKWRNRLNRAEDYGIKVSRQPLAPGHWLMAAEVRQAKTKGYRSLPPALSLAFARANPGKAMVFEARRKGVVLAAALFLRHGRMATWQIGHSGEEGRQLNAMNLVLWTAMCWLAERGHEVLDLGQINTQDAAGLAHFKLGTGAEAVQLGGSWLHFGALAPLARRLPLRLAV